MRQYQRYALNLVGEVWGRLSVNPCRIYDLSAGGAELELSGPENDDALPETATLNLPLIGQFPARRVWRTGRCAGYTFALDEDGRKRLDARLADSFGT